MTSVTTIVIVLIVLVVCIVVQNVTGVRYYPKRKPAAEKDQVLHHPRSFMIRLTRVGGKTSRVGNFRPEFSDKNLDEHLHALSIQRKTVDEGYDLKALGFGINRYHHGGVIGRLSTALDSANSPYAPGR